jgi:hypothetical protein
MPELKAFAELEQAAVVEEAGEEKKVVNAPHWRRWREKSKLVTINLNG